MYMDVYLFMYINTCLGMRISVFTYIAMHIHTKTVLAFIIASMSGGCLLIIFQLTNPTVRVQSQSYHNESRVST